MFVCRSLGGRDDDEERLELGDAGEAAGAPGSPREHVVFSDLTGADRALQLAERSKLEGLALDGSHDPYLRGRAVGPLDLEPVAALRAADARSLFRHQRVVELVLRLALLAGDVHRRRGG